MISMKDWGAIQDVKCSANFPVDMDALYVTLYAWVYGEQEKEYSTTYPAGWWEAFKDRWFPRWLKDRYPVSRTTFSVRADLVYTDFKPQMPKEPHKLRFTPLELTQKDGEDTF
jgi:hypothetical protein